VRARVVVDADLDEAGTRILKGTHQIDADHADTHEHNRGYGGALLSGFGSATKQWGFYTDGDGQYDPAELELLVAKATDGVDVVQGYKLDPRRSSRR
jgi:glycosyltransferase involved in cell wall biosynthesis